MWVTSDPHFGHANVIKYCKRPFETCAEMDEALIANWNDCVRPKDIIYVLGDFSFHHAEKQAEIFKRLNGHKHLIIGNHDGGRTRRLPWISIRYYAEVTNHRVVLFHFPIEEWHKKEKKRVHLHGHSHGNSRREKGRLDVGVDCHDYRPIHIEEAIKKAFEGYE